jgi:hypothetical protein
MVRPKGRPDGRGHRYHAGVDQLSIARDNAEAEGLANIHFIHVNAYDTGLPPIVHCRMLLL